MGTRKFDGFLTFFIIYITYYNAKFRKKTIPTRVWIIHGHIRGHMSLPCDVKVMALKGDGMVVADAILLVPAK